MNGFLKYLTYLIPGFNKETLTLPLFTKLISEEGILLRPIQLDALSSALDSKEKAAQFKSYLCYGEGDNFSPRPILYYNSSHSDARIWFYLGHEFGHYCLHPFLGEGLDAIEEIPPEELEEFLGLLEVEADHLANLILLPDTFLHSFYDEVKDMICNAQKQDLVALKKRMYEACLKKICGILTIDQDKIPERARLNLKVRVHKFISNIEEQLIIFFDTFDCSQMDHSLLDRPYAKYLSTGAEELPE